jgi:hypothetical protein
MNYLYHPEENERLLEARESFSGRLLTDAQFDEAIVITSIIEREIKKNGAFKEKLADYSYAFSRTENFDSGKAETIVRDLFRLRTGQSMNQMREALMEREEKLAPEQRKLGHEAALGVGELIQNGVKMSFHRAFAHQGQSLAQELGITDAGAKRLMKEEFAAAENADFYEWGKDLEERFYRPQIEAERQQAEERREQNGSSRSQSRSRSNGRARASSDNASDEDGRAGTRFRRAARSEGGPDEMASAERSAPAQTRQRSMRFSR